MPDRVGELLHSFASSYDVSSRESRQKDISQAKSELLKVVCEEVNKILVCNHPKEGRPMNFHCARCDHRSQVIEAMEKLFTRVMVGSLKRRSK